MVFCFFVVCDLVCFLSWVLFLFSLGFVLVVLVVFFVLFFVFFVLIDSFFVFFVGYVCSGVC